MMEESSARNSAKWKPHSTFAQEMGLASEGHPISEKTETGKHTSEDETV